MVNKPRAYVATGLALLALAACTGNVLSGRAACTGSTVLLTQVTGECDRTIDELAKVEAQHIAIQTSEMAPFVTVDFELAVDQGQARILFIDSQGEQQAADAARGQPASGSVRVRLDALNQISFKLEPVGGLASGVTYHLKFVCDCMP